MPQLQSRSPGAPASDTHASNAPALSRLRSHGFKPVALPALAAAMTAAKQGQPRPRGPKDVPAILRLEALSG